MNELVKDYAKMSKKELAELYKQKEMELGLIADAIEFQKVLDKPYQYQIFSARQNPKGKLKQQEKLVQTMESYVMQDRIGSGLISSGFATHTDVDGVTKLIGYMYHKQRADGLLGKFDGILRGTHTIVEGSNLTYKELFPSIFADYMKDNLYLKDLNKEEFLQAMEELGDMLDNNYFELIDTFCCYRTIKLSTYKIMQSVGTNKVLIIKK